MNRGPLLVAVGIVAGVLVLPASAQSLQDRIAAVRQQRAAVAGDQDELQSARKILSKLSTPISEVDLKDMTAREAVKWVRDAAGLEVVARWERLQEEGIDPDRQVQVSGRNMTPVRILTLIAQQVSDEPLLVEPTPWYVELITKTQANQHPITLVYPVQDLTQEIPDFTDAPQFDLQQITQQSNQQGFGGNTGTGGGGGRAGGQGGLFSQRNQGQQRQQPTAEERGEEIARLIRETIEPDIWRENGGSAGSIRYYNGNLIVRAPRYVHRQIGGGGIALGSPSSSGDNLQAGTRIDRRYVQLNMRATQAGPTTFRQIPQNLGAVGSAGAGRAPTIAPGMRFNRDHAVAGVDGP